MKKGYSVGEVGAASAEPSAIYRYDAFISYSHDPRQSAITAALQQAVQRFAKPFWKRRAVSLFRDQTNLSVNPDLWGTIVEALQNSNFLILIASPEAAHSPWVAKEIDWWLSQREAETIIIVLTTGSILWSHNCFSDIGTTALPAMARTAFKAEPFWLDLSGIASDPATARWRREGRFVDAVASIASRLRGIPKEDLIGEDLKRHRQTIAAIIMLLAVAISTAVFAEWQRRVAVRRADETVAAFIWSRLDFESTDDPRSNASVRALWDLTTSTTAIRHAFLQQLALDRYQVGTVASAPASIARAFGLRPDPQNIQRLLFSVLSTFPKATDSLEVKAMAQAAQIFARMLVADQDHTVLRHILGTMQIDTNPYHLQLLVQVAQTFSSVPEQDQTALDLILDAIGRTTNPFQLQALAQMVWALDPSPKQVQAALRPITIAIQTAADTPQLLAVILAAETLYPNYSNMTPELAQSGIELVLKAIQSSTNSNQNAMFTQAIQVLGPKLAPEQTQADVNFIINVIKSDTDFYQLAALAQAIQILGPKLTPEASAGALDVVLFTIPEVIEPAQMEALTQAIKVLGPNLTPEQAYPALQYVVDAVQKNGSSWNFPALAQAIQTLVPKLISKQIGEALDIILNAVQTSSEATQFHIFALAVEAISAKLTSNQVQIAFRQIIDIVQRTTDSDALRALNQTAQDLLSQHAPTETQATLDVVLNAIRSTTDPAHLQILTEAINVLCSKLSPEQNQNALHSILNAIQRINNADLLQAMAQTLDILVSKLTLKDTRATLIAIQETIDYYLIPILSHAIESITSTPEQGQSAARSVYNAQQKLINSGELEGLAQAMRTLRPTPEQAEAVVGLLIAAMRQTTDANEFQVLAEAMQTFGPTPGQAHASIGLVLDVIPQTTGASQILALAKAVRALEPTPEQTRAVIDAILRIIPQTIDDDLLLALAQTVQSLEPTPEQAEAIFRSVSSTISNIPCSNCLQDLAQVIQVLGPKLEGAQVKLGTEPALAALAQTDDPAIAQAYAQAIAVTLHADPEPLYVAALVELLKWPTTVGLATDRLLEALHERVPGAPGKEAGLAATIAWVAATYPDIDLDSPPKYPASCSNGGA